ncbi:MAG: glycosyltransferase [Planctomycetes bacterium]|nr:glycosyltransferase [Planctomycetota bacterium]
MLDLSVVIINRNTRDSVLECLSSIANNVKEITCEIIVVDNNSTDGSVQAIKEKHPQVKILENESNVGFAYAVNQGLKEAKGRYYLSLNSDTQLTPGALEKMVRFMDENLSVGMAGAQLVKENGEPQNSFDNFPGIISTLFNKSVLRLLFPSSYAGKNIARDEGIPFEVESLVGACMIIRPSALDKTGWFDQDYFVFLEETDLCLRMRKAGLKVMVIPQAKVFHFQGETKKQTLIPAKVEYLVSLYKYFRKNSSLSVYRIIRITYPFRLLCQSVFTFIGCVFTIGLVKHVRIQCYTYSYLFLWHLLWCPEEMSLKGISEKLKQMPKTVPIKWVIQDVYLDTDDLPVELDINRMPYKQGFESTLLKETRLKRLVRFKTPLGRSYLIKMYKDIHPFSWLKNRVSGDKAMRDLVLARKISYLGIPNVVPVAVGFNDKLPWTPKYYIAVTRELENACGLNNYLSRHPLAAYLPYNQNIRRRVVKAWGQMAGKIHQRGILQDDFDPNNIVLQFKGGDAEFYLFLVDFERVKILKKLLLNQQIHSLAKLSRLSVGINNTDRLTFLKGYLNTDNKTIIKTWIKQIKKEYDNNKLKDYLWAEKVSLLESSRIGRHNTKEFTVFYRKKYPENMRPGFNESEIIALLRRIKEGNTVFGPFMFIRGNKEVVGLSAKAFPHYKTAKNIWQNLNALLRIYTVPALPVALIKDKKSFNKGIIVFEPINLNRYVSGFFVNPKIQERLTGINNIGIK